MYSVMTYIVRPNTFTNALRIAYFYNNEIFKRGILDLVVRWYYLWYKIFIKNLTFQFKLEEK